MRILAKSKDKDLTCAYVWEKRSKHTYFPLPLEAWNIL